MSAPYRLPIYFITAIMICGMLCIGLYPFNYFPRNAVSVGAEGGLSFFGRGTAISTGKSPLPWVRYAREPMVLELLLRPYGTNRYGVRRILSLCDARGQEVAYLAQWRSSLILRFMEEDAWLDAVKREVAIRGFLTPDQSAVFTLVFQDGTMAAYVNGEPVAVQDEVDLPALLAKHPVRFLVLGSSSVGDNTWQGEILGLSLSFRETTPEEVKRRAIRWLTKKPDFPRAEKGEFIRYNFSDIQEGKIRNLAGGTWPLFVPDTFRPLRRPFLSLPSRQFLGKSSFYADALVNLAGFLPLGWILMLLVAQRPATFVWWRAMITSIAGGALLSLFIEANQVFLVSRTSSVTDLVLNTAGAAFGAATFWLLHRKSLSPTSDI